VNSLGAKSRAGFTAKPQLIPNDVPTMIRQHPIKIALTAFGSFELFLSVIARIARMKNAVAKSWSQQSENVCKEIYIGLDSFLGNVANMP